MSYIRKLITKLMLISSTLKDGALHLKILLTQFSIFKKTNVVLNFIRGSISAPQGNGGARFEQVLYVLYWENVSGSPE